MMFVRWQINIYSSVDRIGYKARCINCYFYETNISIVDSLKKIIDVRYFFHSNFITHITNNSLVFELVFNDLLAIQSIWQYNIHFSHWTVKSLVDFKQKKTNNKDVQLCVFFLSNKMIEDIEIKGNVSNSNICNSQENILVSL